MSDQIADPTGGTGTETGSGGAGAGAQGGKPNALMVNLDGMDLTRVDELLKTSYNDPVRSRLLEAARAQLMEKGPDDTEEMMKWHIDIHSDW